MTEEYNPQNEQSKDIPNPQNEQSKDIPIPEKDENKITIKKSSYDNILKALVVTIAVAAFFGGYGLASMDNSNSVSNEEITKLLNEAAQTPRPTPQPTPQPTQPPGPQIIQGLLDDDPVKGNPDAPVTIVEFSDFQCPFCKRFHETTLPLILENYVDTGKVKFVYRDFPIESLHPNGAIPTALAAQCANEQGMFWQFHDKIFQTQNNWERLTATDIANELKTFAVELGLDTNQFNDCLDSEKYRDEVNNDLQDGASYGVTGTPGFFIGNEERGYIKVSGAQPYSTFQNVLDQMLAS